MMRIVWIVIALCSLLWTQHVMADCKNRYKIGVVFFLYHQFVDTGYYTDEDGKKHQINIANDLLK